MGKRLGRSIAVASERGVCLLDLSRMRSSNGGGGDGNSSSGKTNKRKYSPCVQGFVCSSSNSNSTMNTTNHHHLNNNNISKWRLFGNEKEEQSFRVIAMTWWERDSPSNPGVSDDLLLAVVQYADADGDHYHSQVSIGGGGAARRYEDQLYLVCWSRRR
eukprot:13145866-Ditylum_brightwellii.AAC.1